MDGWLDGMAGWNGWMDGMDRPNAARKKMSASKRGSPGRLLSDPPIGPLHPARLPPGTGLDGRLAARRAPRWMDGLNGMDGWRNE